MGRLDRLFQPGRIGKMELKNRLVMPAMGMPYADEEGYITQRMIDYYVERAKGGRVYHHIGNIFCARNSFFSHKCQCSMMTSSSLE